MERNFRKVIAESFTEPKAKRKEEFFRSIEEPKRSVIPFYGKAIAAAACCVFAVGIGYNISNSSKNDISGEKYTVTDPTLPVPTEADTVMTSTVTAPAATTASRTERIKNKKDESITTAVVSAGAVTQAKKAPTVTAGTVSAQYKNDITADTPAYAEEPAVTQIPSENYPNETETVTTTNVSLSSDEYERSFIMKKLTAFLAAISIGAVSVPDAHAVSEEYFHGMKTFGYNEEYSNTYEFHIEALNAFDAPTFDKDINDDGVFDIVDCYALFTYYNYEDIIMNSKCHSGAIKFKKDLSAVYTPPVEWYDVSELFMDYFVRTNDMKKEYLDPSYYMDNIAPQVFDIDNIPKHLTIEPIASHFANYLLTYINSAPNSASLLEDITADENIDLDLDGDGSFTIADAYIYHIFDQYARYYKFYNLDFYGLKITDREDIPFDENLGLTDEQFNKCREFFFRYGWKNYSYCPFGDKGHKDSQIITTSVFIDMNVLLNGCLSDNALLPEYTDASYYEGIISGAPYSEEFVEKLNAYCKWFSIGEQEDNPWLFNDKEFVAAFNYYCNAVENGKASEPDINSDGILDDHDYNGYFSFFPFLEQTEYPGSDNTILTPDEWNRITSEFDMNNNGICGDMYDYSVSLAYILMNSNKDIDNDTIEQLLESENYEQNTAILANLDIERSGDSNCDGETGLADALLILQNNANSGKYQLSNTGIFNADVYNTGDGVTPMDALEIQKRDAYRSID